jgi:acetyl esterase
MKTLVPILLAFSISISLVQAQTCNTGRLDPRVARALKTVLHDLPGSPTASVEQIRDVRIPVSPFPQGDLQMLKVTIDSIPIQVFNPLHTTGLPMIIYYHPGGFVTPLLPFMQYECWRQAKAFKAIVVAVDYRIAPEHPFPAAVDDSYNAFKWISANGQTFGGDTAKIVVEGLSAGGNLAAVVCQKALIDGISGHIKLQVLNCPSTDNARNNARYNSFQQYASGYFQTKAFSEYTIQAYAPNEDLNNPEIGPINRQDLRGLPPALLLTAEFDPLRDEGQRYAERLQKAGVHVWSHCFPGQIHCLLGLPPSSPELKLADKLLLSTIGSVLHR